MRFIPIQSFIIFNLLISSALAAENDNDETTTLVLQEDTTTPPPLTTTPLSTDSESDATTMVNLEALEKIHEPLKAIEDIKEKIIETVQTRLNDTKSLLPLPQDEGGVANILEQKAKIITDIPIAIHNITKETIKEIVRIPETAKNIIQDAVSMDSISVEMTTPTLPLSLLNPNKKTIFKSKNISPNPTSEKSLTIDEKQINNIWADLENQFNSLNEMLKSTSDQTLPENNLEILKQLRKDLEDMMLQLNKTNDNEDSEEQKKIHSSNEYNTTSSSLVHKLVNYVQTNPQLSSTVVFAVLFITMSIVSSCVNFVFLLVFKLSRKLRKSLLGTFYTDLRRSFNPSENVPLYRAGV